MIKPWTHDPRLSIQIITRVSCAMFSVQVERSYQVCISNQVNNQVTGSDMNVCSSPEPIRILDRVRRIFYC